MSQQPGASSADFARQLLTPRERVVLLAVGQRLTNGEIADTLKLSKRTVESHIAALFAKFGVRKRLDLIALAPIDTEESAPAHLAGINGLLWREVTQLRKQARESRMTARAYTTVNQAAGVMFERYGLPDLMAALRMLHTVARRHGLDVTEVAGALLTAPRPENRGPWFAEREWRRGPELTFLPEEVPDFSRVLNAAVDAAMACADGDRSDLQLSSSGPRRGLDLLASRGFSTAFVTQFAFVDARPVDGKTTACALALSRKESVSIPDVTSSAIFAPTALRTLEAERVRTVHSTPMATAGQGKCIGVLSIHRARPGRVPNRATQAELGRIAGQTGAWVTWQRRTARLHALEDLHERAGGYPATG
jgi:DNA-binding CsgD family transcriptional regulator